MPSRCAGEAYGDSVDFRSSLYRIVSADFMRVITAVGLAFVCCHGSGRDAGAEQVFYDGHLVLEWAATLEEGDQTREFVCTMSIADQAQLLLHRQAVEPTASRMISHPK